LLGVDNISPEMREILGHSVKKGGLGIRNPVDCAHILFGVSTEACKVLSTSLAEKSDFNLSEHKAAVRTASTTARKDRAEQELGVLETRWAEKGLREKWRLKRAMNAGIWLTCIPSRLNGTEISAEEFVDNIRLRYNLQPLNVPECCDGCGKPMSVEHAMSCKVGGLVHIRHDDVAQEFGYLCGLAYKPSRVSYEPLINHNTCGAPTAGANSGAAQNASDEEEENATAEDERADPTHSPYVAANENRGDIAVDGFWKSGRRCIFDVRITDTECRSTQNQDPTKVLKRCEQQKKDKYLDACLEQRRDFTPLVYSVDEMSGRETRQAERHVASRLSGKWRREYSEMVGYVRVRMALAVVRSNSLLLRGSRKRRSSRPFIDEGAAMENWNVWRERY
jgi:hypothetical protein